MATIADIPEEQRKLAKQLEEILESQSEHTGKMEEGNTGVNYSEGKDGAGMIGFMSKFSEANEV